jgi:Cu/Ag efflux protein CusF
MKKVILTAVFATASLISFQSCNNSGSNSSSTEIENTDVVPSGTYTGTAEKVDPDEKEVYVKTSDGKTLELYFTEQTKLMQNGQTASFDALKEGQNLEVTVEKKGNRLEPMSVNIMP